MKFLSRTEDEKIVAMKGKDSIGDDDDGGDDGVDGDDGDDGDHHPPSTTCFIPSW